VEKGDKDIYFSLTNLPITPIRQLEQWLPDRWKRHCPAPSG